MDASNCLRQQKSNSLDWDALSNRCMGNTALIEKILTSFRDRLTGEFEQLEEAFQKQDESAMATIAHRMKGTSLTVSANRLAESAQQIQEAALCDVSAVDKQLMEMRSEILELSELITNRFSGSSS